MFAAPAGVAIAIHSIDKSADTLPRLKAYRMPAAAGSMGVRLIAASRHHRESRTPRRYSPVNFLFVHPNRSTSRLTFAVREGRSRHRKERSLMLSRVASVVPVADRSPAGAPDAAAHSSDAEPVALRERMVDALCTALAVSSSAEADEGPSHADAG